MDLYVKTSIWMILLSYRKKIWEKLKNGPKWVFEQPKKVNFAG